MSSDQGRFNPKLPGSYQPVMNEENFNAPAHHLDTQQAEQVVELAEASAGHIQTGGSSGGAGGFGSGSLGSNNNTNLADTLTSTGGQSGQRGHLGQYEYTENQLDEPRDRVGRDSEFGNTGRSGGLSGTGEGTRQAAGSGVGGGLAAAAASQGLGSTGQSRSIEDQRLGGLIGDDNSYNNSSSSTSRSGGALGAGAGAAAVGTAGAGAYGASSGHGSSGHGGVAGLTSGQRDASGHGAGAGEQGMLAQPQYETGLTSELERRAQKSGTHAAGFGTHGNE